MYNDDLVEDDLIKKLFYYKNSTKKTWAEVAQEIGYSKEYISMITRENYVLPRLCKEKLRWYLDSRKKPEA